MAAKKFRAGRNQKSRKPGTLPKEEVTPKPFHEPHRKAEQRIRCEKSPPRATPEAETAALIHNLHVHQAELDTQNEELRRTQAELEESRGKYSDLYDFAPVGYFIVNATGVIVEANLTAAALLGVERGLLLKRLFGLCICNEDRDSFDTLWQAVLAAPVRQQCELKLLGKDGQEFFAELILDPVKDGQGPTARCRIAVIDLTDRKKAEEALRKSEQKFHGLFTTMSEAVVLFELIRDDAGKTVDCRVLDANPAVEKMTGIAPADAIGRTMRELFPNTDDFWFDTYGKVETTGEPVSFERRFDPLDRVYHTSVYRPAPGRIAVVFTDITERKKAEEELLRSRKDLDHAQTVGNIGSWRLDVRHDQLTWSDETYRIFGIPKGTPLTYETFLSAVHPDDRQYVDAQWKAALAGEHYDVEHRIIVGAQIKWVREKASLEFDNNGALLGGFGIVQDITERKHAAELLEVTARFPSENPSPILRVASDGTILYSNGPGLSLLEEWHRGVGEKAPPDWCKRVAHALDSGRNIVRQVKCGKRMLSVVAAPVIKGGYVNLYGRDITKERKASQALRRAHAELEKKVQERTAELAQTVVMLRHEVAQRMRAEEAARERSRVLDVFFSHTITPLVILDKEFNFVRVNRAYADACEHDISEFAGHNHFELYPHEENQRIFEQVVKTQKPYEAVAKPFSFPDHPEWGVTYWDWTLVPILGEDGEVELLVFSLEDVTARKRSELALGESEARYRALVELSPDPILVVVRDKIAFANPACVELAGLHSADELVGQEIWDFARPESRRAAETFLRAGLRGRKKVALTELKALRPDGRTVDVEASVGPIRYEGEPAVQAVIRDITERKRQQARDSVTRVLLELFAQKTSMKEYLDSVVKIIRIWSGCRCVGIRLTNAEGYIPYEACAGFSEEFVSAESMLCLKKDVCACIRVVTQRPDPQDAPIMTERGSFRCDDTFRFVESLTEAERARYRGNCLKHGFASVAVVPVRYRQKIFGAIHLADEHENKVPLDNVQFLENMAGLIGEAVHRFRIEQALRLSESRLVEAQRIAHLGNWDLDIAGNSLWWSDEVYRIFGLQPGQFGGTNEAFLACVHPDDREQVKMAVNQAIHERKSYNIDHRVIRPDGVERIVHERAKVLYGPDKQPVRMVGTVQDVTEFKQTEQRILADQEALRSLTSELQLTEERERRRIAGDLHDSIGQILALSKWELVRLQKSAPPETAASLNEVANQLDKAVKQARTLSFELSPSVLYDLGFEVALEDLAERFSKERKIKCEFRSSAGREPLPEAVKVLLYRSVRELLINVAKHANATVVNISVDRIDNDLHITVEDNGDGFDVSILNGPSRRPKGFGVLSIQERLRHIGGHFEIQSNNGSGTKVTLVAPTGTLEGIKRDGL